MAVVRFAAFAAGERVQDVVMVGGVHVRTRTVAQEDVRQALGLPVEGLVQRQTGRWNSFKCTCGRQTSVVAASFCLGPGRPRRAGRAFS